ncbi:hypothetical protein Osc7112_6490 (plasmid) [Oscillatoria nigro-viridis PCC 7112]|uniref:Uncharacterized protein n=1 Tax=Phormidium nigroviride PCC 7112 TaxID=179408 RepID=K9VT18_9CYAN|nr:hypothetical protein Osc7112_6490 [Oscillatoria nigro-viridis PCC 7112]
MDGYGDSNAGVLPCAYGCFLLSKRKLAGISWSRQQTARQQPVNQSTAASTSYKVYRVKVNRPSTF